jgi:hypothetical protein
MNTMQLFIHRPWFSQLPKEQKDLVELTIVLYEREQEMDTILTDYSFILFPIAKAYEGFLKQYLYELGLISERTFEGRRFRIGRALNPDIRENQRDEFWLYDNVAQLCGQEMARALWETWLECRNRIFHYFPSKNIRLDLTAVETHLSLLDETITNAHQCKVDVQAIEQSIEIRNMTS